MSNRETLPPNPAGQHLARPLSSLPRPLKLVFHPGGEQQPSLAMEAWVATLLEEAGGRIHCERTAAGNPVSSPSLSLGTTGKTRIFYHFVPEGPEMPVFRELLWEAAACVDSGSSDRSEPEHAGAPREMILFVSTHCPNCPDAVRTVHALARKLANLSVHLFEAMQHAELALRHNIQSVPTLLIDPGLRYVGTLDQEKLLSLLGAEDPLSLLHEQIRQKIMGGSTAEAGEWIAEGGNPSFLAEDLGRSTFQERITLLLTLEEALERDPRCLDRMVEPLLPQLKAKDASVRGDIADLLGKIGHQKALPALMRLLRDPDPNVVEAAAEAAWSLVKEDVEH